MGLLFPDLTEKEAKKLLPSKGDVTVAKLSNKTFVYSVGGGNPVLFEHEDNLYPTVYALWQFPHMSPALLTYSEVSPKVIVGGADLMLPGVIVPDEGLGEFEAGDVRGLRIPQSRFAFAVGRMLVGRSEAESSGMKGKGLGLLHHFPDALWAMGDKSVPHSGFTPERILPPPDGEEAGGERRKKSKKDKKDRGTGKGGAAEGEGQAAREAAGELGSLALDGGSRGGAAPAEAPAASMEELIDACFMRALRERLADVDLPLDCSKFYSGCMLPCRPAGVELDIKRSSYKKLSKLMKTMEKRGVITVKAIRKEDHILEVHRDCPAYTSAAEAAAEAGEGAEESGPGAEEGVGEGEAALGGSGGSGGGKGGTFSGGRSAVSVSRRFKVGSHLRPVFGEAAEGRENRDRLFSEEEVGQHLDDYTAREGLAPADGGEESLTLDKLLKGALYNKREGVEVGDTAERGEVLERLLGKIQVYHRVQRTPPGGGASVVVNHRGDLRPIELSAEDRHIGRKFITRVVGLEGFGIYPDDVVPKLKHAFQCSVAIEAAPGKDGWKLLAFQGKLLAEIRDFLANDYGVAKPYVIITGKVPP